VRRWLPLPQAKVGALPEWSLCMFEQVCKSWRHLLLGRWSSRHCQ
jgi:hypothetical protein